MLFIDAKTYSKQTKKKEVKLSAISTGTKCHRGRSMYITVRKIDMLGLTFLSRIIFIIATERAKASKCNIRIARNGNEGKTSVMIRMRAGYPGILHRSEKAA